MIYPLQASGPQEMILNFDPRKVGFRSAEKPSMGKSHWSCDLSWLFGMRSLFDSPLLKHFGISEILFSF